MASNGVPQPAASQSGSRVLLAGERQESAKPRHIAFGKKVDIPDHVLKQKQVWKFEYIELIIIYDIRTYRHIQYVY